MSAKSSSLGKTTVPAEVIELHARCGIYTRPETVNWFLDRIGWVGGADLSMGKLLEPAAGDGAFLIEAVERLCQSFHLNGKRKTYSALEPCITAYEIHPEEVSKARGRVIDILISHSLSRSTGCRLAEKWIRTDDFLTADTHNQTFTQIVGNPPYIRWSHIPNSLRMSYEKCLPSHIAKGDLCLAFLGKCLSLLTNNGCLGFLCADRWMYAAYGEEFRNTVMPSFHIEADSRADSRDVFDQPVSAYPIKLVVSPRVDRNQCSSPSERASALSRYNSLRNSRPTLREAGMEVRVGPALGIESAFTGTHDNLDVEGELLHPYVRPKDLSQNEIHWSGTFVICLHDSSGKLRNISDYPRLSMHLEQHRKELEKRSIVKKGALWYRPIDRVMSQSWCRPKLLLPEMTTRPRAILDKNGRIPSHGIYAVFDPNDDVKRLESAIDREALRVTLAALAPRLNGGAFRCYKKFIELVPFSAS